MVEMGEKISVIVPVYNVEQYVAKCIESILNQTYKNMEVLLIDDGATDKSGNICDFYAEKDNRVRVHHKINEGLSEARNIGVKLSSADYIVFVDSDDYIVPDMLEVLYGRMQEDKSDLAICNFLYVDESGKSIEDRNENMPIKDEVIAGEEAFARLVSEKYWYYVTAWNKLYKKKLWEGIKFPKGKIHEDEFIAHFILDRCRQVSCVSKALYRYVQREHSITSQKYSVRRLDGVEAFCARVEYARKKKNYRVAADSLEKATDLLMEGYRRLGKEKECRNVLKERRRLFNKTYISVFFYKLGTRVRMKGMLAFVHPKMCMMLLGWIRKGKRYE